ncbi:esterase YqiA [Saccharobesus litoralis]|uniref:Esterase YqiA n=1 Tax=Saccharobesus litoralis TaxID=2172099 RepID=A0A2S0VVE8_9ALTE|nr:YqiA/YcfP family alpha/beta fold hydrolase [Saccharobesus litoralis]AWB68178.1 esterase YqiA [Saccharobesus litoralis]
MTKNILYLHGFLSSPKSVKAQLTKEHIEIHHPELDILIPQLPNHPEQTADVLQQLLEHYGSSLIGVVGSSLGGYLATWVSQQLAIPGVLINPAAYPYVLLQDYLGWHKHPYTGDEFEVTPNFNEHLKYFDVPTPSQLPLWLLLQTEDETLNYREAVDKYQGCQMTIEEGGDHAFQGYERFLPQIVEFFQARLD